jgi:TatA/E family protein of Tat protein translocase
MFDVFRPEVLIILVAAVIFLGPKRLPEAGKTLGRALRGFREETQGLRDELADVKDHAGSISREVKDATTATRDSLKASVTLDKPPAVTSEATPPQ